MDIEEIEDEMAQRSEQPPRSSRELVTLIVSVLSIITQVAVICLWGGKLTERVDGTVSRQTAMEERERRRDAADAARDTLIAVATTQLADIKGAINAVNESIKTSDRDRRSGH